MLKRKRKHQNAIVEYVWMQKMIMLFIGKIEKDLEDDISIQEE